MEMGRRDLRRGVTNRISKKQSGSGFASKPKKRRMMKKQEEFSPSDLENELRKKKKSKLIKMNLKESNGVDHYHHHHHHHASIPRKLRSAMKKRNLESVSKQSKKLNRSKTGIESFKKDLIKKEDQEMEEANSMMISNDEKEVAETLFGLAEMFTETNSIDKKTLSDEKETSKVVVETDFTNLDPAVSVLSSAKTKQTDEKPLDQSEKQSNSTGMVDFLERLKQNCSVNMTDATAKAVETSEMDYKSNGLPLWPGLSSTVQSRSDVLSKSSSTTKLPPWMDQAVSPSKIASHSTKPRKLNKCASHVHIARLIKALQTSKIEQRSLETSERGLTDPSTNINDFRTTVSPPKRYQNPQHLLDINRAHNPNTVQEGITQIALDLYGPQTLQKQSYDFLSLSPSGVAPKSHFTLPNSFPQYPYNSHHVSPYQSGRFQTAYSANQQLQKRLWAAQYRPPTRVNNTAPSSSNQYSKPNLSLNLTTTSSILQPLQVASSSRYNDVSQQQHRLMAAAAAMSHQTHNPSRTVMNRQEHHFPLIYEDSRTPLQLLCNEQS